MSDPPAVKQKRTQIKLILAYSKLFFTYIVANSLLPMPLNSMEQNGRIIKKQGEKCHA